MTPAVDTPTDAEVVTPAEAEVVTPAEAEVLYRPGAAAEETGPGLLGPPWPLESWIFIQLKGYGSIEQVVPPAVVTPAEAEVVTPTEAEVVTPAEAEVLYRPEPRRWKPVRAFWDRPGPWSPVSPPRSLSWIN